MTYTQIIALTGILLIIMPFIGIPLFWKYVCIVIIGLFLNLLAYTRNARRKFHKVYSTKTFTESKPEETKELKDK